MGHATLLDVFNQAARLTGQIADTYSREKKFQADMEAEKQWNTLQKEITVGVSQYINSNIENEDNVIDMEGRFGDEVQRRLKQWEDNALAQGSSKYYVNTIQSLKARGESELQSSLYKARIVKEKERNVVSLNDNLDSLLGGDADSADKLKGGLEKIEYAFNSNAIDISERSKFKKNWVSLVADRTFQSIADTAVNTAELEEKLDGAMLPAYQENDPGIELKKYRDKYYQEGERRIQQTNQTNLRNLEIDFRTAEEKARRNETETYSALYSEIAGRSGNNRERYRKALDELNAQFNSGKLKDSALVADMQNKQRAGLDYKAGLGDNDYSDKLATTDYFTEDVRAPKAVSAGGSGGDAEEYSADFEGFADLVYIQSQKSGKETGANAGLSFNQAVEAAVEQARSYGLFDDDDKELAAIKEDQIRIRAVAEIGEKLKSKYINNSNLAETSIFKTLTQDSQSFMDKQRVAQLYGLKDKTNVPSALIAQAQGELWNSVMDILGESGTAQGSRETLNRRVEELYKTYTDKKYAILWDNAQSESAWERDNPVKLAEALRTLNDEEDIYNPGYHQAGRTGKGHLDYGENINDTAQAVLEDGANVLARSLGWENDGNTAADIGGRVPVLSRGNETYRLIGKKANGRETLVVQKRTEEDGKTTWKDAPDKKVNLDTRKFGQKVYDYFNPESKPVGPALRPLAGTSGKNTIQWGGGRYYRPGDK
jgi:hypothetical protein